MSNFAIAGLQLSLAPTDNLDLVIKKTRKTLARFPWVQMVVASELAICGAVPGQAETLPSRTEERLCTLAKELGIWFIPGSLYEKRGGKVYNTTPVINPEGEVVNRYSKIYPFYPYEKDVEGGDSICVFDVPDVGRFGISICYDIWFPETSRAMAFEGVEVIIHPTLTDTQDRDVELSIIRATAAQNQCYVIDVNGTGEQAWGRSQFVGPEADVIHSAGRGEEIMLIDVDLARVRRTRERGILGLGQPLKSFRDAGLFMSGESDYLSSLGPLTVPVREK